MGLKPRPPADRPGGATTGRLVYRRGTSNKFFEATVDGPYVTEIFGRVGTKGRSRTQRYVSPADAQRAIQLFVQRYLKKGYVPEAELGPEPAPPKKPAPAKPKRVIAQTMTFLGSDPVVLYSSAGTYFLVRYVRGEPQRAIPVAKSMWLSTSFTDAEGPAIMLAAQRGTTQLVRPEGAGRSRTFPIATAGTGKGKRGYLGYATTFRGDPYLLGYGNQVYRFTGDGWVACDAGLEGETISNDAGFVVHGDRLLVLDSIAADGFALHAFDGSAWSTVCRGKSDYNCLASHDGAVYLAGEEGVLRVPDRGAPVTVYRPPRSSDEEPYAPWSACSFGGDLLLSDHQSVKALRDGQLIDLGAPADPKHNGSSHNDCLHPVGDTLYHPRRDGVFALRKGEWSRLPDPRG